MAGFLAFFASPIGMLLIQYVPKLVGEILAVSYEKGLLTADEVVAYIQSQKTWDEIPPVKPGGTA